MRTRTRRGVASLLALSLVAAACGGDDDDTADEPAAEAPAEEPAGEGKTEILVTGPERSEEQAGALQEVLGAWGDANGVEVTYIGSADWEAEINTQIEGGNPPDISIFPQPGKLADFANAGYVVPVADFALAENDWTDAWNVFGTVDGVQYGVPVKSDMKSLVWYQPARFEAAGYDVPTTFADFLALVDTMAADGSGTKPLCVGIESGQATGWTYTDWVEEMVLRQHGADVYDQWVSHEIPFSDDRIMASMQAVIDLWTDDNVYAASGTIAATAFGDNGQPLVDGDCYMHRQASFFSGFIPEGTPFADGTENAVDVFYFPDINGDSPVLGAGTLAAAFNADPNVHALLGYMASAEYAEARQVAQQNLKGGSPALSGFLSAAQGIDTSVFEPLEQSILEALGSAQIVRFDASDLMPADVGAGTFWTEGTSLVNGDITVAEAAATIDASWPTDTGSDSEASAEGKSEILVTGPERSEEQAGALQEVLGAWGDANGVEVTYIGSADWEAEINTQIEGGNPPDISIFPQPGKLADFADAGYVVPLSDAALAENDWTDAWNVFGTVDGVQYGMPVKSDMKSLVWYQPARFEAAGYDVPTTFADFLSLVETMANDGSGTKPLCVGIESGQATGWTYTDWVEEMVLRQHGADVYDQWVSHEIPFSDARILESMQAVIDLWTDDNVYAASGTIAATAFGDNGQPLVDGDCYMHRQASFFSGFIPDGTPFADGSESAIDVFYFPDINGDSPVLGAGTLAAAFNADPNVHALLGYMGSAEYAEARQVAQQNLKGGSPALSGFLSAAQGIDASVFEPLEQSILEALGNAQIVRFDASDLMPADVGAGTFWTEGTSLVNGDITVEEAAATIDASWPE